MLIERKEYLDKLLAWKDKQLIKLITGVRRCGKSTLMEMFQARLKKDGVEEQRVLSVNFEDYDFYDLRDPAKLYAYIKERLDPNAMNYIFLDEVQHVADFPRVVDSLYIKKNIDLYLTGSNAYMLSGETATLLSGRYVEISMLPLSFREYVESTGSTAELGRKYADYVIIDTPPAGILGDAEIFARYADEVLLVVRQNYIFSADINDTLDGFRGEDGNVLGVVLNGVKTFGSSTSLGRYGYGRYGKYGKYGKYGNYTRKQRD